MTFLLLLMILAAALGGLSLWFSGLLLGRRARAGAELQAQDALMQSQAALGEELRRVRAELENSNVRLTETEDERVRLNTELEKLKAEAEQADGELERLREELEQLRANPPRTERPTPATPIEMVPAGPSESDEGDTDSALAELDIERVAHRETKAELEKLKAEVLLIKSEAASSRPSVPPGPGRGKRFQTVSIATRSEEVPAFEHDRLRAAFENLQREKEKLEADYARTLEQLKLQALQDPDKK
jgi:DNA repair exonuclease SbcCD ATPase subunit